MSFWKDERHITNRSFRIVDLTEGDFDDNVKGRTFEDCTVYGPAVLLPVERNLFDRCTFGANIDALLWEVTEGRESVVGAIGLYDCTFRRCRFICVGIARSSSLIEDLRRSLNGETKTDAGGGV